MVYVTLLETGGIISRSKIKGQKRRDLSALQFHSTPLTIKSEFSLKYSTKIDIVGI